MSRPCTNLIMSCAALGTLTGDRRATVDLHRRLMREEPAALAAVDEAVSTGAVVSFTLRGEPATVGPYEPTPAPRRYLAVKLDAGNDTSGNPRRGWLIYLDTPESPILGWVEEGYCGDIEMHRSILSAEQPDRSPTPRQCFDLRDSGRVRVLCSMSVPYSEIREARRTPFKLPAA